MPVEQDHCKKQEAHTSPSISINLRPRKEFCSHRLLTDLPFPGNESPVNTLRNQLSLLISSKPMNNMILEYQLGTGSLLEKGNL